MNYWERTSRHKTIALLAEIAVGVILLLTVPMLWGSTFQFRYGRVIIAPLALGICWFDAWSRGRAKRRAD